MEPWSADHLKFFLAGMSNPSGESRYHAIQGFLFAVACAPRQVEPADYVRVVFGGALPAFETPDEGARVIVDLLKMHSDIRKSVLDGHPCLPADCPMNPDPVANFDAEAPIANWSHGFLDGHRWLAADWAKAVPRGRDAMLDFELDYVLLTLQFFASRKAAVAFADRTPGGTLANVSQLAQGAFDMAMKSYARIGRAHTPPETPASALPLIRTAAVGRNAPCPCGSGRKYKKCCGSVH